MQFLGSLNINFNETNLSSGKTAAFFVDTPHEVKDLKKGSQLGEIDLSIEDSGVQEGIDGYQLLKDQEVRLNATLEGLQSKMNILDAILAELK